MLTVSIFNCFSLQSADPFPIENRPLQNEIQDMGALAKYRHAFGGVSPDSLMDFFRDFHLLAYLATQNDVELYPEMEGLMEAVREDDGDKLVVWTASSASWQTYEHLLDAVKDGFQ